MSFREDGAAAVEWVASYLERLRDFPVLAQVEPGQLRDALPAVAPDRLDLRDAHARLAGEAGLRLVISSDGHSANALRYVDLGVAQARRAWLTKDHVLNTRTWKQIEKLKKR